jgi:hypothetical protein
MSSGADSVAPRTHRTRIYVALAVLLFLVLSFVWKIAQPGYGRDITFDWADNTGFKNASVKRPPARLWIKLLVWPVDELVILQAKPHIVRQMHQWQLTAARGEVPIATLGPLPIVLGVAAFGEFRGLSTSRSDAPSR